MAAVTITSASSREGHRLRRCHGWPRKSTGTRSSYKSDVTVEYVARLARLTYGLAYWSKKTPRGTDPGRCRLVVRHRQHSSDAAHGAVCDGCRAGDVLC